MSVFSNVKLFAATLLCAFLLATQALAAPVDHLAQAKQLALPAKAYPELTQIYEQVNMLITRMETNTNQFKEYRQARIRGSDRRYSGLTRELNQSRSRLSEVERKLEKAPSLDANRFPMASGGDRGSSSSTNRDRAIAAENKKYEQAKLSLKMSLKALSDHYDFLLKEIAKVR